MHAAIGQRYRIQRLEVFGSAARQSFTAGMDATSYVGSQLVQAAVERKFEANGD